MKMQLHLHFSTGLVNAIYHHLDDETQEPKAISAAMILARDQMESAIWQFAVDGNCFPRH